ncbi:Gfo/Idh/MocA family oxidoreductase [Paenibacillus sp. sgz500958]|uniref:Gfo/Idh/MocA family oxidoreductase n=1 Tax=Paenibacillus sp. sgz500958 TaxID=3242475 RepID=UPI0036D40CAC
MNTHKKFNIGILGCSTIAPFSIITPTKELDQFVTYAVASRDLDRSKAYALKHHIPHVFESYDQLLESVDIDVVYIPLSNFQHKEWTLKAIEAHKHVLIEKPMALHADEVVLINERANEKGVHVLEALMVQHHSWQQDITNMIATEKYGKLKKIRTRISFEILQSNYSEDNYRFKPEYGGGCFIDECSYWLQFIQKAIGLKPQVMDGFSTFSGINQCDWTFNATLQYEDGVEVEFLGSFEMPNNATHWLEFEKANVRISGFFKPCYGDYKIVIQIENIEEGTTEKLVYSPQNYYVNQLQFFAEVIRGERDNIPLSESFERIATMNAIYEIARNKHFQGLGRNNREQEIRNLLVQLSDSAPNLKNASEEADLRSYGMDSLLFIQFVVVLEEHFSIEVTPEFLDIDKLYSLKKWKEYIDSQDIVC